MIVRVEKLGAEDDDRQLRARPEHLLDPGRRRALPVRPDHHVVAGLASGGAGADIAVIVGVAVTELDRVVALRIDRRHGKDDRLCPQVQPHDRIGRVAVRRDDRGVLVGEDVGLVLDLVERRLELPRIAIDGVLVHDAVVHHDRQAVDEACFGNVLCLEEAWTVGARLRMRRSSLGRRDSDCSERCGTKKIAFRQHDAGSSFGDAWVRAVGRRRRSAGVPSTFIGPKCPPLFATSRPAADSICRSALPTSARTGASSD